MLGNRRLAGLPAVLGLGLLCGACAQAPVRVELGDAVEGPLRGMLQAMAATPAFSYRVVETTERFLDSGQKVQYSARRSVLLRRPDRLAAETEGDLSRRRAFYDGSTLSVILDDKRVYATAPAPPTVALLLDSATGAYGLRIPMADLPCCQTYEALVRNVDKAEYVGLHEVGGRPCHHLALREPGIEWQIWIDAGEGAFPRKLVVTDTAVPGRPEYCVVLTDWDAAPDLPDSAFEFVAPEDAIRVNMGALLGIEEGEE